MADGVLRLVDAFEGVMPQTRLVLQQALALTPVVVRNKLDKPHCLPEAAQEQVFALMCQLDATEGQLDFTTLYDAAKQGASSRLGAPPTPARCWIPT